MDALSATDTHRLLRALAKVDAAALDSAVFVAELQRLRALALVFEGRYADARQRLGDLERVTDPSPEDQFNARVVEFVDEFRLGSFARCQALLDAGLAADDTPAGLLFAELVALARDAPACVETARQNRLELPAKTAEAERTNLALFGRVQRLEEFAAARPGAVDVVYLAAILKVVIEFHNEALQNLDECIEAQRLQNWRQYYWRGVVLARLGDPDQAHKSFLLAQNLVDKADADAGLQIVEARVAVLAALGETSRAKGILEQFVEAADREADAWESYGDIFLAERNFAAAEDFLGRAVVPAPAEPSPEVAAKLLVCVLQRGDLKRAKALAKTLSRQWPWRKFDKNLVKAACALAEDNPPSAAKYLAKARALGDQPGLFSARHLDFYEVGALFLRKDFPAALARTQALLAEVTDQRQTLQASQLETVPMLEAVRPEAEARVADLAAWGEELAFNRAVLSLLSGRNEQFWDQIKAIDFPFYENLRLLESADFANTSSPQATELRFHARTLPSLELATGFEVGLLGHRLVVYLALSLPAAPPARPAVRFERWLPREFDVRNFGLPLRHPLLRERAVYAKGSHRGISIESNGARRSASPR